MEYQVFAMLSRTRLRLRPGYGWILLFSAVFTSLKAKWGNGLIYITLDYQVMCFGATYHLCPSGIVLQPFNYLIPQIRSPKSDKLMGILGCWALITPLSVVLLSAWSHSMVVASTHSLSPGPPWGTLGTYATILKWSLLDSCSSSSSRRECCIWIMYMELVTETSSSITTLKRNTSFKRQPESLR